MNTLQSALDKIEQKAEAMSAFAVKHADQFAAIDELHAKLVANGYADARPYILLHDHSEQVGVIFYDNKPYADRRGAQIRAAIEQSGIEISGEKYEIHKNQPAGTRATHLTIAGLDFCEIWIDCDPIPMAEAA